MNIEALAREAGGSPPNQSRNFWEFLPADLDRFAALIRAQALEDAARAVEGEALEDPPDNGEDKAYMQGIIDAAAAVRALKDKP